MNEGGKITVSHRRRSAAIYVRQSTLAQVERNKESTARQYDLVARARQLGWPASAIRVIDGDLGVSGSVLGHRDAFDGLVAEVALGQVGIILALEVSRLVRDNAAWYRLLDLAGACDTLVADADGIYLCRATTRTPSLIWCLLCSSGCSPVLADQAVDGLPALDPGSHIDRLTGLVQRRSLFPRLVGPMFVVVLRVLGEDLPQVLFAVDQEVVKALAPSMPRR
jgi:hypothetical protein